MILVLVREASRFSGIEETAAWRLGMVFIAESIWKILCGIWEELRNKRCLQVCGWGLLQFGIDSEQSRWW
jgi:hypothetical protein